MEAQWQADRATLRTLLRTQPAWTQRDFAQAVGRSLGWVKKWSARLRTAPPDDLAVLRSQSRARKHPPPRLSQPVIERLLQLRDQPPARLHRVPGPRTLRYYLEHDPQLQALGLRTPRSTRTIWRILHAYGRIGRATHRDHVPVERPAPLTVWQLDFKDATSVPPVVDGKQQHVVEILNTVDTGTSILLDAHVRDDFTAATTLHAVAQTFAHAGLPEAITIDRDPRFVGSVKQRDFPSPLVRFCLCLGVNVTICPPHRPDKNAFVERYHRTFEEECLRVHRPTDVPQVQTVTTAFKQFYNEERPHQGLACGNQPPRVAFPDLPPRPPVPTIVDPDRWVEAYDGRCFARKVKHDGRVTVDARDYYVTRALVGTHITLRVVASTRELVVEYEDREVKRLVIKGLRNSPLPYATYLTEMLAEARTDRQPQHVFGRQLALSL